jgi:hypothetical protein
MVGEDIAAFDSLMAAYKLPKAGDDDFDRKGTSAFSNRIGDKVAADEFTVVDDGTLNRRRGPLNVDDEGAPTQCTVLIETAPVADDYNNRHRCSISPNRASFLRLSSRGSTLR